MARFLTRKGQHGVKRHPTIEDNVTIYSNSSVLGGETVNGENTIIGGKYYHRIDSLQIPRSVQKVRSL